MCGLESSHKAEHFGPHWEPPCVLEMKGEEELPTVRFGRLRYQSSCSFTVEKLAHHTYTHTLARLLLFLERLLKTHGLFISASNSSHANSTVGLVFCSSMIGSRRKQMQGCQIIRFRQRRCSRIASPVVSKNRLSLGCFYCACNSAGRGGQGSLSPLLDDINHSSSGISLKPKLNNATRIQIFRGLSGLPPPVPRLPLDWSRCRPVVIPRDLKMTPFLVHRSLCNCLLPEALKITAVQHDPDSPSENGEKRRLRSAFGCLSSISMRQRQFSTSSLLLTSPFRGSLSHWDFRRSGAIPLKDA
ncbi:hypothetical protein BHE74_00004451 [Ensete ventricosum]|nr:hypothetical protein BHE74_00004451 [Ensete ventricosum]